MMPSRTLSGILAAFCIAYAGCGKTSDFNEDKVKEIIEDKPLSLDGEQVSITQAQVDCGSQSDLWDKPVQFAPDRFRAALSQKARDLKFSDDVLLGEPGFHLPYAQVRGDFALQVDSVSNIKDDGANAKLANVKVGIKVANDCFSSPLPMMGVRRGNFKDDAPPIFRFKFYDDAWHLEKLVH